MTELDQQIARMRAAYARLPAFVRSQGAEFFGEVLATFDAVQAEARELRRLIAEG